MYFLFIGSLPWSWNNPCNANQLSSTIYSIDIHMPVLGCCEESRGTYMARGENIQTSTKRIKRGTPELCGSNDTYCATTFPANLVIPYYCSAMLACLYMYMCCLHGFMSEFWLAFDVKYVHHDQFVKTKFCITKLHPNQCYIIKTKIVKRCNQTL